MIRQSILTTQTNLSFSGAGGKSREICNYNYYVENSQVLGFPTTRTWHMLIISCLYSKEQG